MAVITKKIRTKSNRSAQATIKYILNIDEMGEEDDKVLCHTAINFFADSVDEQIQEIEERHKAYNGASKILNEHHVISYESGDSLQEKDFYEDALILLEKLGKEEHAAIFAVHKNTEHTHVHIYKLSCIFYR